MGVKNKTTTRRSLFDTVLDRRQGTKELKLETPTKMHWHGSGGFEDLCKIYIFYVVLLCVFLFVCLFD